MGFKIWHYVGRFGVLIVIPLMVCSFFLPQHGWLHAITIGAFGVFFVLGCIGAILAVLLLFTRFRFSCSHCNGADTQFGSSKKDGMWLQCHRCGHTVTESGLLHLQLSSYAAEIPEQEELEEP